LAGAADIAARLRAPTVAGLFAAAAAKHETQRGIR